MGRLKYDKISNCSHELFKLASDKFLNNSVVREIKVILLFDMKIK